MPLSQRAAENFNAGDFAEALRIYKLAHAVCSDPRLLYNIARALHKQGQAAEAAPYYQQFIDSPVQDEAHKQKAGEYLRQIPPTPPALGAVPKSDPIETPVKLSVPAPAQTKNASNIPIYKKWWFWTVLGTAVAAGIAGGVAGGVIASQRLPDPRLHPFE